MTEPKIGVLLMAYGAAHSLDDIEPYLNDIRGGRTPSPELIEEIKSRYRLMGGRSPLFDITKEQAAELEKSLNKTGERFKVYIGMRHWHPYIKDTVATMAGDGVHKIIGLCLTPYYSKMSVGAYEKKLQEAIAQTGREYDVTQIKSWNDHPLLIEALAEKVSMALDNFPKEDRESVTILFSAHSLPERILREQDPYPDELNETVELVMKKVGKNPCRFGFQSKGRTPEPWLGPDAATVIDELAAQGHKDLVMAPIGFISDHMETLFDVDVTYRKQCESKGIRLERAASLNTTPLFIQSMQSVIQEHLSN